MATLWDRVKTEQTNQFLPFKQLFTISQRQAKRANSTKKSLHAIKILSERSSFAKPQEKTLKEENIRLISKIMQISHRKIKPIISEPSTIIKKRQNPQRQREITIQNQRLGRSLIRIKSGKSVEKIKNDIAKSLVRMQRKKKRLLSQKQLLAPRTITEYVDQQPQDYNEILGLSKTDNISSHKLSRANNLKMIQFSDFKRQMI